MGLVLMGTGAYGAEKAPDKPTPDKSAATPFDAGGKPLNEAPAEYEIIDGKRFYNAINKNKLKGSKFDITAKQWVDLMKKYKLSNDAKGIAAAYDKYFNEEIVAKLQALKCPIGQLLWSFINYMGMVSKISLRLKMVCNLSRKM